MTVCSKLKKIKNFRVYLRPYLDAFLYNCSKKFEIAVWTTTNKRNTVTLTNLLVLDIFKPLFVWSEDECDTVGFGKTKETFKDLQRVFEKYPQFNKNNTIVLDDSVYKASLNEDFNSLHLPSFTVCDPCFNPLDDAALLSVLKYFNVMFFKKTKDVTEFISSNRFVEIQSEADESAGYKAPSHALVKHNEPTFVILPMWKLTSNEITLFVGKTDRLRPEYSPELILKYSDDNIDSKVIYIWNDVNFTPEERRFRERRRKEYSAEIENATFSEKNEFKRNRKRTSHKIGNNNGGNKKQKRYVSLKKLV